jgi:hypothetical protein
MSATATYPLDVIARLLMLTPRRVQQLVKEGIIPKAERGRYELVPAVQGYIRYLKDRAIGGDMAGGEAEDKARLMKARADIAQFEAQRLAEELAPVDEVERAWADLVASFRARCLAVPTKAAPMVAVEETTEACHEIIETFIHEALAEIAATKVEGREPTGSGNKPRGDGGGASAETDDLGMG